MACNPPAPKRPAPCFLDFEASSLSDKSYPIEVAWSLEDGSIESHLISPAGIPDWTDWSPEAEKVHGITRSKLLAEGESPRLVRRRMDEHLNGKIVYSDAPDFDGMWLSKLLAHTGSRVQGFELLNADDLLVGVLSPSPAGRSWALIKLQLIKQQARSQVPGRHRAAWDVQYLLELWKLVVWSAR